MGAFNSTSGRIKTSFENCCPQVYLLFSVFYLIKVNNQGIFVVWSLFSFEEREVEFLESGISYSVPVVLIEF